MGLETLVKENDHVSAAYERLHQFYKDAPKSDVTYPYDFEFEINNNLSSTDRLVAEIFDSLEIGSEDTEYSVKFTVGNTSKGHRLIKQLEKTFSTIGGSLTVVDSRGYSWEVYSKNAPCPIQYAITENSNISSIDIWILLTSSNMSVVVGGMKKETVDTDLATAMTDFGGFLYSQSALYDTENPTGIAYETVSINGWGSMMRAMMSPIQTLEDIITEMLDNRDLTSAVGTDLDRIGDIVGTKRRGELDDDYRLIIQAKILENNSDGTASDIQLAAEVFAVADRTQILEQFPAKFQIAYTGIASSYNYTRLVETIAAAKVAGVGFHILKATSRYFAFSNDPGGGGYYDQIAGLEAGDRKTYDFENYISPVTTVADDLSQLVEDGPFAGFTGQAQIKCAQSFTVGTGVAILDKFTWKGKRSASASGYIRVAVMDDNSGSPGTLIFAATEIDIATMSTSNALVVNTFPAPTPLLPGKYWIVIEEGPSGWTVGLGANIFVQGTSTNPLAGEKGVVYTGTWQDYGGIYDLYFVLEKDSAASGTYLCLGNVFTAQESELLNSVNLLLRVDLPDVVSDFDHSGGTDLILSGNDIKMATDFTPSDDYWIDHVSQWIKKTIGSDPDWQVTCALHADSGGEPGAVIATAVYNRPSTDIGTAFAEETFYFEKDTQLLTGVTYWIVMGMSGTSAVNPPYLDLNVAAGHVGKTSVDGGLTWSPTTPLRAKIYGVDQSVTLETIENLEGGYNTIILPILAVGQTFTPSSSGQVAKFDIKLEKLGSPNADFLVELRETVAGEPTGTVLASTTVSFDDVDWGAVTTYTFDSPGAVASGTNYALLLTVTNIVLLDSSNFVWVLGDWLGGAIANASTVWYRNSTWYSDVRATIFSVNIDEVPTTTTAKVSIYDLDGSFLPDYTSLVVESAAVDLTNKKQFQVVNFPMSLPVALVQGTQYACIVEQLSGDVVTVNVTDKEYFNVTTEVPWIAYSLDQITNFKEAGSQMYMDILYDVQRTSTDYEAGGFATLLEDSQAGYYSTIDING